VLTITGSFKETYDTAEVVFTGCAGAASTAATTVEGIVSTAEGVASTTVTVAGAVGDEIA